HRRRHRTQRHRPRGEPMSIRVILVDDHPVVRAGLRSVVDAPEHIAVIGEADSGEGALAIVDELDPDVVLCDLRLGEGIDGIEVTKRLRALPNPPAVLILTTFDLDSEIVAALNAGASGYLLKDIDPGDISIAIEKAAKGGTYLPPEISSKAIAAMRNPGPKLTRREREVVKLLATGASNAQIAQELFVTEATVQSHLVNVFTKLGVDSRARAVRVAEDRGLVGAPAQSRTRLAPGGDSHRNHGGAPRPLRVHRGLGAPPLVGLSSVRSAVVSAMEDRGRSAGPICSASPCPGSLFPARRTSRPVHIETAEGIWQAKTRCLRAPPYCPTAASERPREVRKASRSLREPNRTRKRRGGRTSLFRMSVSSPRRVRTSSSTPPRRSSNGSTSI